MYSWAGDPEEEEEGFDNSDFGGKSLIIFLVDCTKTMNNPLSNDSDGLTGIQKSLNGALATIKNKIFTANKDCVGVVGFGTRQAKCPDSDFETIRQIVSLIPPCGESILSLEELVEPDTGIRKFEEKFGCGQRVDVRLHEALWQCQSLFASVTGKVARKTILLLTNISDPHGGVSKLDVQARRKAVDLHNTGIYLDVVPVCDEDQKFDRDIFYHGLIKLADDEATIDAQTMSDLTGSILKKTTTKRSMGRFNFQLGGLTIGVSAYNLLGRSSKPTKQKLASDTNEEVSSNRNWVHPITRTPLLPSDMKKFVTYGGKSISMTEDEVKSTNSLGSNQSPLKLCGFKHQSSIKLGHHVRLSQFLYPDEGSVVGSRVTFSALVQRCDERQVVAICQFKARATSKISFVALFPQLEEKDQSGTQVRPPGFHIIYLPYMDDFRKVPIQPLESNNPPENVEAAKEVISKLRLKTFVPVESCSLQTHFKMIEAHALQRSTMEKLDDESLPDLERMSRKLGDRSSAFLSAVYDDGYNPDAPPKKKSANEGVAKTKKDPVNCDDIDMKAHVAACTVGKLTMDILKGWLTARGSSIGKKKKAELVEEVIGHF